MTARRARSSSGARGDNDIREGALRRGLFRLGSRTVLVWSLAVLVVVVAIGLVWQALAGQVELSELLHFITGPGYLLGFPLLYIEESGVPLPLPGDVFLMYAGKQLPHNPTAWAAARCGWRSSVW